MMNGLILIIMFWSMVGMRKEVRREGLMYEI